MAFRPKDIHVQYLVVVLIKVKTPNWPRETLFILLCQKSMYFLLAPLIIHWYLSHYIDIRPAIQNVTHSAEFQDNTFSYLHGIFREQVVNTVWCTIYHSGKAKFLILGSIRMFKAKRKNSFTRTDVV